MTVTPGPAPETIAAVDIRTIDTGRVVLRADL